MTPETWLEFAIGATESDSFYREGADHLRALLADRDRLKAERDALAQELSDLRESVQWLQGCPPEDKVCEELHHAAISDLRRWERTRGPGAVGNPVMHYEDFLAHHARRQGHEEGAAERDALAAELARVRRNHLRRMEDALWVKHDRAAWERKGVHHFLRLQKAIRAALAGGAG